LVIILLELAIHLFNELDAELGKVCLRVLGQRIGELSQILVNLSEFIKYLAEATIISEPGPSFSMQAMPGACPKVTALEL
jgi:hypothetical protein